MAWESRRGLLRFYAKHYRAVWFWPLRALIAARVLAPRLAASAEKAEGIRNKAQSIR